MKKRNLFGTGLGIVIAGALIGVVATLLQKLGNPGNMGLCMACFTRDIAGAVGLHQAAAVQYLRPEIIGVVFGALFSALFFGEFRARCGSAPVARFFLGAFAMIGALVFLGCPWRVILRLAGGDWNAVAGLAGLVFGIFIGTRFLAAGFNLGRSASTHAAAGWLLPFFMLGMFALLLLNPLSSVTPAEGAANVKSGVIFYSLKGPGSMHAFWLVSIFAGLAVGFLAQRSRFCTMGAFRDLILFRQSYLFRGVAAMTAAAFLMNSLALGQFRPGFSGQPVAHSAHLWNFLGMTLSGLAFSLAGGCPGRQLILAGEGDGDASVFVLGMLTGAAFSHNFALNSSDKGLGANGVTAVLLGLAVCFYVGFTMREKK